MHDNTTNSARKTKVPLKLSVEKVCGVVLCGGKSSRFGTDKALAPYGDKTLVSRAHASLSELTGRAILATGNEDRSYDLLAPQVGDRRTDAGPLAGIEAAFGWAKADVLLILATDLPLVTESDLRLLMRSYREPLTLCRDGVSGREQPLCALWDRSLLPSLSEYLESGKRSVMGFIQSVPYSVVDLEEGHLLNVNNPAEIPPIDTQRG